MSPEQPKTPNLPAGQEQAITQPLPSNRDEAILPQFNVPGSSFQVEFDDKTNDYTISKGDETYRIGAAGELMRVNPPEIAALPLETIPFSEEDPGLIAELAPALQAIYERTARIDKNIWRARATRRLTQYIDRKRSSQSGIKVGGDRDQELRSFIDRSTAVDNLEKYFQSVLSITKSDPEMAPIWVLADGEVELLIQATVISPTVYQAEESAIAEFVEESVETLDNFERYLPVEPGIPFEIYRFKDASGLRNQYLRLRLPTTHSEEVALVAGALPASTPDPEPSAV